MPGEWHELGGIFVPVVGYMVDRVGPRKLLISGVAAVGLGGVAWEPLSGSPPR